MVGLFGCVSIAVSSWITNILSAKHAGVTLRAAFQSCHHDIRRPDLDFLFPVITAVMIPDLNTDEGSLFVNYVIKKMWELWQS